MDSLRKIENNPAVIFRPFMENGELRREYGNTRMGGFQECFPSLRTAKLYMHRPCGSTWYRKNKPTAQSLKNTKYEVWAFHVGKDQKDHSFFPPTCVYIHEPK